MWIVKAAFENMAGHCRDKLPHEACGALWGRRSGERLLIDECRPITNRAESPTTHFRFDRSEWIAALYAAESSGRQLLGVYHSHPTAKAAPSAEDRSSVWNGLPSYWILSFAGNALTEAAAYSVQPGPTLVPMSYSIVTG